MARNALETFMVCLAGGVMTTELLLFGTELGWITEPQIRSGLNLGLGILIGTVAYRLAHTIEERRMRRRPEPSMEGREKIDRQAEQN